MKTVTVLLEKLLSAIIVVLIIFLIAEVLFVMRHGYLFRLEDLLSFIGW
ncbi:MAG: hypothetical protein P8013_01070 [Candidatus Sulfobium sp.]|jgi:hypothetical protein